MARMRFTAAVTGLFLTAAVLLSGCSAGDNSATSAGDSGAAPAPQEAGSGATKNSSGEDKAGAPGSGSQQPTVTRAIIKTGSLTIEVPKQGEVDKKRQEAIGVVTALRGQVASEDTGSQADGTITRANLVLKVPTASYETAIQRLSGLGKRTAIHQESNDVTEQVVDVDSRISSQRASLERMRTLLSKATTIGEIVSVETELTRREADLESLLAKQKNLSLQTELATLSLVLVEPGEAPEPPKEEENAFVAGLRNGWDAFTATVGIIAMMLGAVLPFLIVGVLIGVPLWRLRHRLRRPVPATVPATVAVSPTKPDQP